MNTISYDQIYDQNHFESLILTRFKNNKRASISAMFRKLKKHPHNVWGDYPLIRLIIDTARGLGVKFTRKQIWHTITFSEELKSLRKRNKTALLNQLLQ